MNEAAWESWPHAPARGTVAAKLADMPDTGTLGVDLAGFPLLLLRGPEGIAAFVNACPHQYLPLDWRQANVLSPDGARLRCSNHAWLFDAASGDGLGEARGCALDPVPVHVAGGAIVIGAGTATDGRPGRT